MAEKVLKNWEDDGTFLEERADHLPLQAIEANTAIAGPMSAIVDSLLHPGAKLLVGPRGCGKTHLMRYAFLKCVSEETTPFCFYVSFNRYYHLEPLLRGKVNGPGLFIGWIVCLCYLALHEAKDAYLSRLRDNQQAHLRTLAWVDYPVEDLRGIIDRLERGGALDERQQNLFDVFSVDGLKRTIERLLAALAKARCIVLLDDAALTLTPEYLPIFFDFFRVLKSPKIAPKASVYPGTPYGPRFHAAHEAEEIQAWFSVDDAAYVHVMEAIGRKRFVGFPEIDADVRELLKFAAFGVPRAYLILLREYTRSGDAPQRRLNSILENFLKDKEIEYATLSQKVPKFATLIRTGWGLFRKICDELTKENQRLLESAEQLTEDGANSPPRERYLFIGIQKSLGRNALIDRMLSLLVESGLLYKYSSVSHGHDRSYDRYVPHLAALIRERAFSEKRGFSAKFAVNVIKRPEAKHPVRRGLPTLLSAADLDGLKLDLPACKSCDAPRASDKSKFCDSCGAMLFDGSKYDRYMAIALIDVPGLTEWQKTKLAVQMPGVKTVGDFLALRDPGSALREVPRIGEKRAEKIARLVEAFVADFFS